MLGCSGVLWLFWRWEGGENSLGVGLFGFFFLGQAKSLYFIIWDKAIILTKGSEHLKTQTDFNLMKV